ncbi:MAG TPA: CHRD domain-containing protein [Sphingomicrobium sp.]|nr:CHRD domain-containing protein [Sphingomicrobium sp.]
MAGTGMAQPASEGGQKFAMVLIPGTTGDPNASGTVDLTINPGQERICWELTTSGVNAGYSIVAGTGAHIHGPSPLVNLGLVLNGTSTGCSTVPRSTIDAILKNPELYYVNLHWADVTEPITLPSYSASALSATLTKRPLKSND